MQNSARRYRFPRARADLRFQSVGGSLALADVTGRDSQPINFTAALVLTYCDGRHDAGAIADAVAGSLASDSAHPDSVRADVRRIIDSFAKDGYLD
ncbi:MAG TPA: PqqD family protein [Gemmatimonadales bacterium]|nr:PqqD family protein [Gemmatimonadales bacterium]